MHSHIVTNNSYIYGAELNVWYNRVGSDCIWKSQSNICNKMYFARLRFRENGNEKVLYFQLIFSGTINPFPYQLYHFEFTLCILLQYKTIVYGKEQNWTHIFYNKITFFRLITVHALKKRHRHFVYTYVYMHNIYNVHVCLCNSKMPFSRVCMVIYIQGGW